MEQVWNKWGTLGVCALLSLLTLAVYWPITHHDFIGYDDPDYVSENTHVQAGLSPTGVAWAFRTQAAGNWHPLTWLSHQLDVQLFGLSPGRHHATSLVVHLANTLLLFLLIRHMTGACWRGAWIAALFALHPLHVESVAWIAERKDVLSTLFFLLTLWLYTSYVRAKRPSAWLYYGLALGGFTLGLMCKPMLVTLPFLLLLLDHWPLNRLSKVVSTAEPGPKATISCLVWEKVPFLFLAIACSLITMRVQNQGGTMSSLHDLGWGGRLSNATTGYLTYLGKTIWPTNLAVFYPHPALDPAGRWPIWQLVTGALLLASISVLCLLRVRKEPWFCTGWFWFVGTLVPVIGLVQVGSQAMADRYTYIPLIGIFIGVAWALAEMGKRHPLRERLAVGFGVMVLVACVGLTRKQVDYWGDDITLFEHALAVNDRNAPAHTILGTAYGRQGKLGIALVHGRAAVQADPTYAGAWHTLGDVSCVLGQPQKAIQSFETALRLNPTLANTWFRLAFVLASQGKLPEAVAHYQTALRLNPDFVAAHNNLATVLWSLGRRDQALAEFTAAARLDPGSSDKRYNLGTALADQGRLAEAAAQLTEAVRLDPGHAKARERLGLLLAQSGDPDGAIVQLREALRLAPGAEAYYHVGLVLAMQRKLPESVPYFREALKSSPNSPAALNDLAWILATAPQADLRDGPEAVRLAERACALTGRGNIGFLNTLAAAYAEAHQFQKAVEVTEKARELALAVGEKNAAQMAETRLTLYRAGQPFRQ